MCLIILVGIETAVEFCLLLRGEPERLLIGGDTIPQILDEPDSLF